MVIASRLCESIANPPSLFCAHFRNYGGKTPNCGKKAMDTSAEERTNCCVQFIATATRSAWEGHTYGKEMDQRHFPEHRGSIAVPARQVDHPPLQPTWAS
jgi:hypothetical protein